MIVILWFFLYHTTPIIQNLTFFTVILKYCCFLLQLAGVDVMAALDMFVERGEWEKCLQTAEQQVYIYLLKFMPLNSVKIQQFSVN